MSENILVAQTRTEFGKGAARRARRAGLVPAVLYGHGSDPIHLDVPAHDLFLIVRSTKNALVELRVDGAQQLALVKDVQVHALSRALLHVDFLAVKAGEKVEVTVPLVIVGEPAPGSTHNVEEYTVPVVAPATAIPEEITVDITGLEIGTVIRVQDLVVPEGVSVQLDADQDLVSIVEIVENVVDEPAAETAAPEAPEAEAPETE
jgi:large subunit ribosomal protein L25